MDDSARSCYAGIVLQAIQGLLESDATSVHLLIPILGVLLQVCPPSVHQILLQTVPYAVKLQEDAAILQPVYALSRACRAALMLGPLDASLQVLLSSAWLWLPAGSAPHAFNAKEAARFC